MCQTTQIKRVLEFLADNVQSSASPDLVNSTRIASELNLTVGETKRILKTMNQMGVIQADSDTEYCLITRSGINSLTC